MMTVNPKIKGSRGLHETAAFIAEFPLATDPSLHTLLSTADFDDWAEKHNYYTQQCEQATLLDSRNRLRKKINVTAASPAWLAQGQKPFCIMVHDHGKSYTVQRVEDAFSVKAQRLPRQVNQYASTKKDAIEALVKSMAISKLSPAWQSRVLSFHREIGRYLRAIQFSTTELNREYSEIRAHLKAMAAANQIAADDDGLIGLFGPSTDDSDGDDD